eukprot:7652574-Pyramimonas_sp.AAC.1
MHWRWGVNLRPPLFLGGHRSIDTGTPRTSPRVLSDQTFEENPAVATRAFQDEQRHRQLFLL